MSQSEIIISGPELSFEIYNGSFSEYLLEKLRKLPQDKIIQVNGETGEQLLVQNIRKDCFAVAEGLKESGLEAGKDIVPIIGNYTWNLTAAVIGGMLSGMAIHPMDPNFKTIELKHYFEPYQPRVIFCEKKCAGYVLEALDMLEIKSAKIFLLDEENNSSPLLRNFQEIFKESDVDTYVPPVISCPGDTTALIINSSGTTGLPKGIMLSHTNLLYMFQLGSSSNAVANRTSHLQVFGMFVMSGISFTLLSFLTGERMIFLRNATPENILKAIEKYKPDHVVFSPALITQLLSYPLLTKHDLSSLKLIGIGGSPVLKATIDKFKTEWPLKVNLIQMYGMTEVSGICTYPFTNLYDVGTVGEGTQMKVVDLSTGKSLGPNQLGELRFKNRYGTMKGYLGNEERTREVFDESGFFCTGDVGYYTEDHRIVVVDRVKEFISAKGGKVSPAQVESVILTIPGVEDVGVIGVPHEIEYNRVMALVVKTSGYEVKEQDIIDYVAKNLSEQRHLRGGVKFVDAIPRTETGKIKRRLLAKLI